MRVAISGTHCCGKTTLIEAFLSNHSNYIHEIEAYEALQDDYGESFVAEPVADEFYRQLEYQVERLRQYHTGDRVIFERSPVDYLAYLLALQDLARDGADASLSKRSIDVVKVAVELLDLIMFLPASGANIHVPASEDRALRRAVDERLESILINDDMGLFTAHGPKVVEAVGTTAQRLQTLEHALSRTLRAEDSLTEST